MGEWEKGRSGFSHSPILPFSHSGFLPAFLVSSEAFHTACSSRESAGQKPKIYPVVIEPFEFFLCHASYDAVLSAKIVVDVHL